MTIEEIAQVLGGDNTDVFGRRSFCAVCKGTVKRSDASIRVYRYCQILWIDTALAANTDRVCVNRSADAGSDCNISASPSGNSTPALTKAMRCGALPRRHRF